MTNYSQKTFERLCVAANELDIAREELGRVTPVPAFQMSLLDKYAEKIRDVARTVRPEAMTSE